MKAKQLLFLFLLMLSAFACGRPHNEQLIIEFYPSFHPPSVFSFNLNPQEPRVSFEIMTHGFRRSVEDTIVIYDSTTVALNPKNYEDFLFVIDDIDFDCCRKKPRRGILDGISGKIEAIDSGNDTIRTIFMSPPRSRNWTLYEVFDAFFDLMGKEFRTAEQIDYLEDLKMYFGYGLSIRKINDEPHEYKIWRSITAEEEDIANAFFESLPSKKPIILDISQVYEIDSMYFDSFRQLNKQTPTYYLNTYGDTLEDLAKIGNCKMFGSRAAILKVIQSN